MSEYSEYRAGYLHVRGSARDTGPLPGSAMGAAASYYAADMVAEAEGRGLKAVLFMDAYMPSVPCGLPYDGLTAAVAFAGTCETPPPVMLLDLARMRRATVAVAVMDHAGVSWEAVDRSRLPKVWAAEDAISPGLLDHVVFSAQCMEGLGDAPCVRYPPATVVFAESEKDRRVRLALRFLGSLLDAEGKMPLTVRQIGEALLAEGLAPPNGGEVWATSTISAFVKRAMAARVAPAPQAFMPVLHSDAGVGGCAVPSRPLCDRIAALMPRLLDYIAECNVDFVLDGWVLEPWALAKACVRVVCGLPRLPSDTPEVVAVLIGDWFAKGLWTASASGEWRVVPVWSSLSRCFVPVLVGRGTQVREQRARGLAFVE